MDIITFSEGAIHEGTVLESFSLPSLSFPKENEDYALVERYRDGKSEFCLLCRKREQDWTHIPTENANRVLRNRLRQGIDHELPPLTLEFLMQARAGRLKRPIR